MEWFKSKGGQVIALVTIVSTLAGFGYAGAGYVNRLENLEKKIGGIGETEDAQQEIEQRFEGIETSIQYINKSLDNESTGLIAKIDNNDNAISSLTAQLSGLSISVKELEKDVDKLEDSSGNPLAN
tara:strand:+ start:25 stop:402 length:378 start_codon:yes stop_codon:yes gene_type:complete